MATRTRVNGRQSKSVKGKDTTEETSMPWERAATTIQTYNAMVVESTDSQSSSAHMAKERGRAKAKEDFKEKEDPTEARAAGMDKDGSNQPRTKEDTTNTNHRNTKEDTINITIRVKDKGRAEEKQRGKKASAKADGIKMGGTRKENLEAKERAQREFTEWTTNGPEEKAMSPTLLLRRHSAVLTSNGKKTGMRRNGTLGVKGSQPIR